jgi:hypothetical protein
MFDQVDGTRPTRRLYRPARTYRPAAFKPFACRDGGNWDALLMLAREVLIEPSFERDGDGPGMGFS